jgi:hypothetical protein
MTDADKPDQLELGTALSLSIGSDKLDVLVSSADVLSDKLITTGAFDGVPIVGMLTGGVKFAKAIRDHLYLKKIVSFLNELNATTKEGRDAFVKTLEKSGKIETFGSTILLILDSIDDASKPAIVGRIIAAHISGKITSLPQAMRLVAIVNRVYPTDIEYLSSFRPGLPDDEDIASSLYAAGLLSNTGFDGGGSDQDIKPGGFTYDLNEYGRLLIAYGIG